MQRFLVVAFFNRLVPNCGPSNLSTFSNKKVAFAQTETLKIGRSQLNDAKVTDIDSPPLDGTIA